MLSFRKSTLDDIDRMVVIANQAKELLKQRGVNQWQRGTYPDRNIFEKDVEEGIGFVVTDEEQIVAICAMTLTDEICYRQLISGSWLTAYDDCYVTIHRAAVAREYQGHHISTFLFEQAVHYGKKNSAVSVRVDTHPDNKVMQRALNSAGFQYCGEFYIIDGDEAGDLRYGYERKLL